MAHVSAADLLVGSDEDFVINLYLAVLGRWPDAAGLAYFVGQLAADPDGRPGVITELATSPEAMQHGQALAMPDPLLPAEPMQALGAQLALRSEFLHRLASTPPPVAPAPMDAVAPLLRELRAELDALRREMREALAERPAVLPERPAVLPERPAALPAAPGAGPDMAVAAPHDLADYMNDLLALSETRMELRIRAVEKRLP